jgi:hypothetical protein
MTGTNFSSWYRQDEGSLYSNFSTNAISNFNNTNVVQIGNTASSVISLHRDGGSTAWRYRTALANLNLTNAQFNNNFNKTAFVYAESDYVISVNGNTIITNTGIGKVSPPDILQIGFGSIYAAASRLNGTIKQIAYYPKRLTDAQLQALTT